MDAGIRGEGVSLSPPSPQPLRTASFNDLRLSSFEGNTARNYVKDDKDNRSNDEGDYFIFPDPKRGITIEGPVRSGVGSTSLAPAPLVVVSPPPRSPKHQRKRSPHRQASPKPFMGVSSLGSGLPIEFEPVSPSVTRAVTREPDLEPVRRERKHSLDHLHSRARLVLPLTSPRSASSERPDYSNSPSPNSVAFLSPPSGAPKLERASATPDIVNLLGVTKPASSRRERSRSPGPPKTSVTRYPHSPQTRRSRKPLVRAGTAPEESRPTRHSRLHAFTSDLDSDSEIDKLSVRARPRMGSLTRLAARDRLSLPVENIRASSMENVESIGRHHGLDKAFFQGPKLMFPDATEARSSFHGMPGRVRKRNEEMLRGESNTSEKSKVKSSTKLKVSPLVHGDVFDHDPTVGNDENENIYDVIVDDDCKPEPTIRREGISFLRVNSVESRSSFHGLPTPKDETISWTPLVRDETPTVSIVRHPQLLFPDTVEARSSFHGLPRHACEQTEKGNKDEQSEASKTPSNEKKRWLFRMDRWSRRSKKTNSVDVPISMSSPSTPTRDASEENLAGERQPHLSSDAHGRNGTGSGEAAYTSPLMLRHRVNSLESTALLEKARSRLSLPVCELRASSFESISPNERDLAYERLWAEVGKTNESCGSTVSMDAAGKSRGLKRAASETAGSPSGSRDDLPQQRKKLSRFLSFFRKSSKTSSKPEFGPGGDSEGSEDERSGGRRYKRNVSSSFAGSTHQRRIYGKHQGGNTAKNRTDSASADVVCADIVCPGTPKYGDVFSPELRADDENILEDSLKRLHEINDGIRQLRQEDAQPQSSRRDSLQRHSTSCPSLAEKVFTATRIIAIEDVEHHRSMQDLNGVNAGPAIVVDDVGTGPTAGSAVDGDLVMGDDGELLSIEQLKKQQARRSSWCPEEERKKEDKSEKQNLLGVTGRSQSLSSLEGDADDSDPDEDSDAEGSPKQGGTYGVGGCEDYTDSEDEEEEESPHSSPPKPEILISGPDGHPNRQEVQSSLYMAPLQLTVEGDRLVTTPALSKAASTPSILADDEQGKKRSGSIPSQANGASLQHSRHSDGSVAPREGAVESPDSRRSSRDDTGDDSERKDERKKKQGFFSKVGSYRQKMVTGPGKVAEKGASASHQFVGLSISNSAVCDVCSKPMVNKSCLQCENCMVSVHEFPCKDQIAYCARGQHIHRHTQRVSRNMSTSLPGDKQRSSSLKSSHSFKESSRLVSSPAALDATDHGSPVSIARNASSPSKALSEEKEPQHGLAPEQTNMTEALSASTESIEDAETSSGSYMSELEKELQQFAPEAEAWSVTVDKRTLKKMTAKDIKRQDTIWEFIQTEKSHCRTLRIMERIFHAGLRTECELTAEVVDRIFPRLHDLLSLHLSFLARLLDKQRTHADKSVVSIGELFKEQFEGGLAESMKQAYGEFCSRHKESVQLYKEVLKSEKKLQIFAKKCSRNHLCKRLDIPACILLVTQRPTKYPLLLESLIKSTKEVEERESLTRAVVGIREILAYIDRQIDEHEKYQKLVEIYNKVDARSSAFFNSKKFKKSDILSNNRKLLHEGIIRFMSARGKPFDVVAVILSDVMFFLVESNQKYSFFSQDNKSSVIPLTKLLVREKGDTKDSKGIYLICQSKDSPEMYELVCRTPEERKHWIATIKMAIVYCLEQEVGAGANREDRKLLEARTARLRQLIDDLTKVDHSIRSSLSNKNKLLSQMVELFGKEELPETTRVTFKDEEGREREDPEVFLKTALLQGEKLMALLQTSAAVYAGSYGSQLAMGGAATNGGNLSRSVSSVGEHSTGASTPPLPKRADTFSGFESKENRANGKKRYPGGTAPPSSASVSIDGSVSTMGEEEADSGIALDIKEKNSRRMSTSFLQQLFTKQAPLASSTSSHTSATDRSAADSESSQAEAIAAAASGGTGSPSASATGQRGSSDDNRSSDPGSVLDLSNLSPAISISNLAVSREQCACLAQLLQAVHGLAAIASQQTTEVERFKAQLAEANTRISQLYSDPERILVPTDKKNTYHHDKQLEELRNLQDHLNQDRSKFEKEKEKQNLEIHEEKQAIKAEFVSISKQKVDLKTRSDELQRQRDALQRQMDLFEQNKAQFYRERALREQAELVSRSSPGQARERSESPASASGNSLERTHRRAGSTDFNHSSPREGSPFEPFPAAHSNSLKEALNKSKTRQSSVVQTAGPSAAPVGGPIKNQLPLHLKTSSTGFKSGSIMQHLPLKLAGKAGSKSAPAPSGSSVKQVLPFKLGSGSSPSAQPVVSAGGAQSSQGTGSGGEGSSEVVSPAGSKLQHTRSQPQLQGTPVSKSRTLVQHSSVTNVLPLKLAESTRPSSGGAQRPKSAVSSSRTPTSADPANKSSAKQDSEILYF